MGSADWIAVDWGTSQLRVWVMSAAGAIVTEHRSGKGMNALDPDGFEAALLELIADALPQTGTVPVICCGMVGARQGWTDAGYRTAPCAPAAEDRLPGFDAAGGRLAVSILPGVKQSKPPDVMRGEETQIAGLLASQPDFDGVVCLPGTHTKWVRVSAGEIVSFQTFMTGELFGLLSKSSVLRHSVETTDLNAESFNTAVSDALSRPQTIAATLFGVRAASLIADLTAPKARGTLSGSLIGMELAGSRPYWLGQRIAIVGEGPLADLYCNALAPQGIQAETYEATTMTLAGLRAAYARLGDPQ